MRYRLAGRSVLVELALYLVDEKLDHSFACGSDVLVTRVRDDGLRDRSRDV